MVLFSLVANITLWIIIITIAWEFLYNWVWARLLRPSTSFEQFRGEWALITGASIGLGSEYAKALARRGMNVILVARSKDKLELLAKEIAEEYNVEAMAISTDLSRIEEAIRVIDQATSNLVVSVVVNNAGGGELPMMPYWQWSLEAEQYTRDLNGTATYRITRLFLPKMILRKQGYILNVGSLASMTNIYLAPYGMEKAKINAFTKFLDAELDGTGVTVQCHLFGAIFTEGFSKTFGASEPSIFSPRPEQCVKASLALLGWSGPVIVPYWAHHIQAFCYQLVPAFLQRYITISTYKNLRKAKLETEEKQK